VVLVTEDVPPALFDVEPQEPLRRGDHVIVQTMWGDERALVLGVYRDRDTDFPMAHLKTPSGDQISISVARVSRAV
jgi:hypothetical protein